jgi:putative nucleotidyltransferase with HDIG domain
MREQVLPAEPQRLAEAYAVGFLRQGRRGWDEPHTRAVVYYPAALATAAGAVPADALVAVTVAWLHDIGYAGLFADEDSTRHAVVKSRKAQHMERGAALAREFVERPDVAAFYTPAQRDRIVHLVGVHDKIEALSAPDEIVFMEADTLGALDTRRVTPTYDYESGLRYLEGVRRRRAPRFATPLGKQYLAELLPAFAAYLEAKHQPGA